VIGCLATDQRDRIQLRELTYPTAHLSQNIQRIVAMVHEVNPAPVGNSGQPKQRAGTQVTRTTDKGLKPRLSLLHL